VDIDSSETIKFYWKVSSEQEADYLEFYIDGTRQDRISGEVGWPAAPTRPLSFFRRKQGGGGGQQRSYTVSSGIHILKWRYVKDGSGQSGDDCGWVDFVQWTGPSPDQDPAPASNC